MTDQQQPPFDVGKWAEDQLALHQHGNAIDLYAVCYGGHSSTASS